MKAEESSNIERPTPNVQFHEGREPRGFTICDLRFTSGGAGLGQSKVQSLKVGGARRSGGGECQCE
jgi:hypothetical protein